MLWLEKYLQKERERLEPLGKNRRIEYIRDKVMALTILTDGLSTTDQVIRRIEDLFRDDSDAGRITCSTVHRSKGLEAPRVWMLIDTFKPNGDQEEKNIWYVSCTRSKSELYFVSDPNYRRRYK
jgi:superfamily I DNA/RNA helicase